MRSERQLDDRMDELAVVRTANSREIEILEKEVRRLEALLVEALGLRGKEKCPEASFKDYMAPTTSTTTAEEGTHKRRHSDRQTEGDSNQKGSSRYLIAELCPS